MIRNQRIDLGKSKLARMAESAVTSSNWSEMAKLLFCVDRNQGRQEEIEKLVHERRFPHSATNTPSYSSDQVQYVLLLMMVLMTAENRTQQVYREEFAQRCDQISSAHGLKDEQYWIQGSIPAEWQSLSDEFENRSTQILIATLREYNLNDFANLIERDGPGQFLEIIQKLEVQFLNIIQSTTFRLSEMSTEPDGSLPEILQSKK